MDLSHVGNLDEVRITSPSGQPTAFDTDISNDYRGQSKTVKYFPQETGDYRIYVTYAGYELPGKFNILCDMCRIAGYELPRDQVS